MNSYMGMRIREWEDGQVNIGIAVCPKAIKRSAPAIGCYWTKDTRILDRNSNNHDDNDNNDDEEERYVLPKSAFIIRPATTSHRRSSYRHTIGSEKEEEESGEIHITYGYCPENGISDLGIMLAPTPSVVVGNSVQDQVQEEEGEQRKPPPIVVILKEKGEQGQRHSLSSTEIEKELEMEGRMKVLEKEEESDEVLELEKVKKALEQEEEEEDNHEKSLDDVKEYEEESEVSSLSALGSGSETGSVEMKPQEKGESDKGSSSLRKPSGSNGPGCPATAVKRVSWVDEDVAEIFSEANIKKVSTAATRCRKSNRSNGIKESNKRESGRKSNGSSGVNKNRSSSTTRRQQKYGEISSSVVGDDNNAMFEDGFSRSVGKRNSGDKSRIPVITPGGDYQPNSCEFYRRQMLRECYLDESTYSPPTLAENWYGYTSLQRYAGEKVMKKFAAEQKRLEEDMSNRRKTEIWILGNDMDDFVITSPTVPIRKKTTRLKPMQVK